jgi:hypothetical protein
MGLFDHFDGLDFTGLGSPAFLSPIFHFLGYNSLGESKAYFDMKEKRNYDVFGPVFNIDNPTRQIMIMKNILEHNGIPAGSLFYKSIGKFNKKIRLESDMNIGINHYRKGDIVRRFMQVEVVPEWRNDQK